MLPAATAAAPDPRLRSDIMYLANTVTKKGGGGGGYGIVVVEEAVIMMAKLT
jgi:hypothetical protein